MSAFLIARHAISAEFPPDGSEISSLQETYNQVNDTDTIRAKAKIFTESLVLDRPISIITPAAKHVYVGAALAAIIAPEGAPSLSYLIAAVIF